MPLSNPRSPTHHTLPEQEAIGCAGPNLEFNGLGYFRQAGKRAQEVVGGGSLWLRLPGPGSQLTSILPPGEAVAREAQEATVVKVGSVLPGGICGSVGGSELESLSLSYFHL